MILHGHYFAEDCSCVFWAKEAKDDVDVSSFDIPEGSVG
jgi:hypothetical protein